MKKSMVLYLLLMVGFGTAVPAAGSGHPGGDLRQGPAAGRGLIGSPHDFSLAKEGALAGENGNLTHLCAYCHAPHSSARQGTEAVRRLPLWNQPPRPTSYLLYGDAFRSKDREPGSPDQPAENGQPGRVSLVCLSCHDGSVAVNEYGYNPGRENSPGRATHLPGGSLLIHELRNHHPVGVDYHRVAAADHDYARASQMFGDTGVTIENSLREGRVECVTCHDAHNIKNQGQPLLYGSDEDSGFCCTCHLKCGGDSLNP